MVNMLNPKNWIWVPLFCTGFVLILLVHTGHAALLKDIRIGEHEDFTRIVFELDAPAASERTESRPPNQLAVILEDTSTDLIRKIPVERSPHVGNIQIWEKEDQLTALLTFDFDRFDHESFSLADPPRLVLDIHPTAHTPDTGSASAHPPPTQDGGQYSALPSASPSGSQDPASQPDAKNVSEKPAPQTPGSHNDLSRKPPEPVERADSPAMPPKSDNRSSNTGPGRLQFYLVVALVAITIVILALLLLMLLARRRWIDDKPQMVATQDPEGT